MSKYSDERHDLLMKQVDKNYSDAELPIMNARINELTILIEEEKRVIRIQDALGEATEQDVIDFFGIDNILENIEDHLIIKYLQDVEAR